MNQNSYVLIRHIIKENQTQQYKIEALHGTQLATSTFLESKLVDIKFFFISRTWYTFSNVNLCLNVKFISTFPFPEKCALPWVPIKTFSGSFTSNRS